MPNLKREPTEEDGPLWRATYDRANAVDNAQTPAEKRKAWIVLIPVAGVAFAEAWLRENMVFGVVLFAIIVAGMGVASRDPMWLAAGVIAGVAGTVLVFYAMRRRWSFGRQWAVRLGVVVVLIGLGITMFTQGF